MRNIAILRHAPTRATLLCTALLAAWITVLAIPQGSRASSASAAATLAAHVDEGHLTTPASTEYFPARFPAPVGEPSEIPATF